MLTTIDRDTRVARPLDEVVDWCRSAQSRLCFPGARSISADGTGVFFEVYIRAPGAAPATVTVDEYLKDHGRFRGGLWFETSQVWTWPNREVGTVWHRYTFAEHGRHATHLAFRWRYILPGLAGGQVANALRFGRSIEKAAEIYVNQLGRRLEALAASSVPA